VRLAAIRHSLKVFLKFFLRANSRGRVLGRAAIARSSSPDNTWVMPWSGSPV